MSIKLNFKASELGVNINYAPEKVMTAVQMYASTKSKTMASYMKSHRPWTDRTGMAKAKLDVMVSKPSKYTVRLTFAHGVDYGVYLEYAHAKKYAIIEPSIKYFTPIVQSDMISFMQALRK